jgi:DNA polymerase-3 subunit gamma/tau
VALACGTGADPRSVATAVAAHLRDALLSLMAPDLVSLPDATRAVVADQARRLGPGALVRALDAIGDAVLALPNAPDPRVTLEVALVKVTQPDVDASTAALLERIERLERAAVATPSAQEVFAPVTDQRRRRIRRPSSPSRRRGRRIPRRRAPRRRRDRRSAPSCAPSGRRRRAARRRRHGARPTAILAGKRSPRAAAPAGAGSRRRRRQRGARAARRAAGEAVAGGTPRRQAGFAAASPRRVRPRRAPTSAALARRPPSPHRGPADLPDRAALSSAWDRRRRPVVERRPEPLQHRRFQDVADGAAVLALPSTIMRDLCDERRPELEAALAAHFGRPVPVRLVVDADTGAPSRRRVAPRRRRARRPRGAGRRAERPPARHRPPDRGVPRAPR